MGRLLMLLRETEDADAILCCPGYMPAFEILMSFIQIFLRKSVFDTPDVAADPLVMQRKPGNRSPMEGILREDRLLSPADRSVKIP